MMSDLCAACLSGNRQLVPHEKLEKYTAFWRIQYLKSSDELCWECVALMKKCWRFYQQVIHAQNILQIESDVQEKKSLASLSSLTTYLTAIVHCNNDPETIIKKEINQNDAFIEIELEEFNRNDANIKIKMEENIDNEVDDKLKSESEESDDFNTDIDIKQELSNEESNLNSEIIEPKRRTSKRKNTCLKRQSGKVVIIETSLFKNGVRQKLPVTLTDKEEKFNIVVVSEEDMLKGREMEKRSDKFKNSEFKCESCILKYKSEESYKQHLSKRHVQNPKYFTCAICLVTCSNITSYTSHFSRHYISYTCKLCLYQNASMRCMQEHQKNKHGQTMHQCNSCNMEFSSGRRLRYHRSKEHIELPPCEQCGKRFVTKAGLKAHMVNHTGITLYKCNICQKDYRGKFVLKAHMMTHDTDSSNENAFCAECNKQFKNVHIYNRHLRFNSKHRTPNVLKYKCSYCDKQFYQKTALTIHEDSIHFKKRAFVCHICNKDFIKKDRLKKHILHDHEGVPKPKDHICPYCEKGFNTPAILNNHIRTHTGEKPYECEFCQTCFRQLIALKTHIKGVHKK